MGDEQEPEATFDSGLVIVHGIGQHAKGSFFARAIGPFLGRMRSDGTSPEAPMCDAEGPLRRIGSLAFDAGVDGAEKLEAVTVEYEPRPGVHRSLLVVEGRWADAYQRASPAQISAWVFRHEIPMLAQVLRYFARGWWVLTSLAVLVLTALGIAALLAGGGNWKLSPWGGDPDEWALALMLLGFAVAILASIVNFPIPARRNDVLGLIGGLLAFAFVVAVCGRAWRWVLVQDHPLWSDLLVLGGLAAFAASAVFIGCVKRLEPYLRWMPWLAVGLRLVPLATYSYQRAVTLLLICAGIVILPLLNILVRILSGIPGLGLVGLKFVGKLEEAIFLGSNFGDMHAVADSPARFARIASAVEHAIRVVEKRVKPGGTVTVLAHSGGGPVAWAVLTEPFASRRLAERKYRLIAAGAAINWTLNGFDEPDTPSMTGAFANTGTENPTLLAHVYGTWDPVPHGPLTPPGAAPDPIIEGRLNIPARNLGEPSLSEHSEYWANQEDVVPVLGAAIDAELPWVAAAVDRAQWNLRTNARLAMVSVLTRVRVSLFIAPVIASFMLLAPAATAIVSASPADADGPRDTEINLLYRAAERSGGALGPCFDPTPAPGEDDAPGASAKSLFLARCDLPAGGDHQIWRALTNATFGNAIAVVVLWLVALGLISGYRDLFWRIGGRTDASLAHPKHGIAVSVFPRPMRFAATWFAMAVVPGVIWLAPIAVIDWLVGVNPEVYVLGLALSCGMSFAEWLYVKSLLDSTERMASPAVRSAAPEGNDVGSVLSADVGRARDKQKMATAR